MDRYDALAGVGLVFISAFAYFVWPPLALLPPGIAFLALGVIGAPGGGVRSRQEER